MTRSAPPGSFGVVMPMLTIHRWKTPMRSGDSRFGRCPAQPAFGAAEVIRLFAAHVSGGNIDEVMALYEPGATYISASGRPLRGRQIEQMFQRLTALRPQMSGNIEKAIEAGDVALVNNRWQLSGQRPDGQPVRSGGISAVVLRGRADGSWGILIDNPWGAGRDA